VLHSKKDDITDAQRKYVFAYDQKASKWQICALRPGPSGFNSILLIKYFGQAHIDTSW
jgi:hypothetical protein